VIFVDGASRDRTVEIILEHRQALQMRVIEEKTRTGVSRARNLGIGAATGRVTVFLNADVLLPQDFLLRLAPHYEAGAVYVKVASDVVNVQTAWCRYVRAQHIHEFGDFTRVGWTEGFSCLTEAARAVGMFCEDLPGAGGEDGDFVERLERQFGAGTIDAGVVVPHVMPEQFRPFFFQWYGRGKSIPFVERAIKKHGVIATIARRLAAWSMSVLLLVSIVPVARYGWKLTRHSSRGAADFLAFSGARVVQVVAHRMGEVAGLIGMLRGPAAPRSSGR
jgi:glycosyltransferase involved in cell wall biosynthesis